MTILITILLLLLIPGILSVLRLARKSENYLWVVAMVGTLAAWILIFIAQPQLPYEIAPQTWRPETLFPTTPTLLVDSYSWYFSLSLVSLLLAVMLTSVARLGREELSSLDGQSGEEKLSSAPLGILTTSQGVLWKSWAANLALTSLGLVAVFAGNLLTVILAWAAIDIIELLIMLGQIDSGEERVQMVRIFSTRSGGVFVLLLAAIVSWGQGGTHQFGPSSQLVSLLLIVAAGLRLGILPLFVPSLRELPLRTGLGTMIRVVPAVSTLVVLVRAANTGVHGAAGLVLLGFSALGGLVGSLGWLRTSDEFKGRPYWILATSSLAMTAAILGQPSACLTWSLVVVFPGSLAFLSTLKHHLVTVILLLGLVGISGLPFTPTWGGTIIFQTWGSEAGLGVRIGMTLLGLIFFVVHFTLISGYIAFIIRGISSSLMEKSLKVDRWIWLLYIPGLLSLPVFHYYIGWMIQPSAIQLQMIMWLEGFCALSIAGAIFYYQNRLIRTKLRFLRERSWLSSELIYRPLSELFLWVSRLISQLIKVISFVLEGEAGILWAFVLLVLGLVILQQV